ncbi:hypothetical protein COLO4_34016 [Corchorus olitorius]|uniref:Uncharacterized protein n=1 Tax=Corchorus olitorius TaxID=93759 RepID=A0A1R3GP50_9ROSI|nr:hypothetical protein COLO4_34016 [Corchorus olitorius]
MVYSLKAAVDSIRAAVDLWHVSKEGSWKCLDIIADEESRLFGVLGIVIVSLIMEAFTWCYVHMISVEIQKRRCGRKAGFLFRIIWIGKRPQRPRPATAKGTAMQGVIPPNELISEAEISIKLTLLLAMANDLNWCCMDFCQQTDAPQPMAYSHLYLHQEATVL